MTPQEQYGGLLGFFSVVLLRLQKRSQLTSFVFDSAAMLFTPNTAEVSCGLKPFTHPSIGIVVSR